VHHNPFSYVDGDIHEVKQYDIDYISIWKIKVNEIRYW
jgi:hypothetical protein